MSEIKKRLTAMGLAQVDDTVGFRGDFKWRHSSALRTQGWGSLWVYPVERRLNVNGKRRGGYERLLRSWVKPTRVDTSLGTPFFVWEGSDLAELLAAMEKRITSVTNWPP